MQTHTSVGTADQFGGILGRQVAHYRDRAGLTQEQLASRLGELGFDISRATIANIEAGGRPDSSAKNRTRAANATIADVLAFALALEVPPILLLAPLGNRDEELKVGRLTMHVDYFRRWFTGREEPGDLREGEMGHRVVRIGPDYRRNAQVIVLFDGLNQIQEELVDAKRMEFRVEDEGITGETAEQVRRRVDLVLRQLDTHLRYVKAAGYEAPELSADIAARMMALRDIPVGEDRS